MKDSIIVSSKLPAKVVAIIEWLNEMAQITSSLLWDYEKDSYLSRSFLARRTYISVGVFTSSNVMFIYPHGNRRISMIALILLLFFL